ncbi:hypothetical protein [Streptomyces iconiensis]|uniref:Transcriptional regulator n=1 Tax=Streptomyces iconiensis TaxID=1384038 RepID=A0ABT7A1F5_9ACTN|nr:hypothetical protein [Streptomyces iconiensis]MDJ1135154.1 hypothetical protein [Streptomyces iconiensis]
MARQAPNDLLRALLDEAGITGSALAKAVNTLAAAEGMELHYTRTSVAKWLTGSRPAPPVAHLVAEVLTRRLGRTVPVEATGLIPQTGGQPGGQAVPKGATSPDAMLASLASQDADPQRNPALHRAPYTVAASPPAWDDVHDPKPLRATESPRRRAGRREVTALRTMTATYARLLEAHGGAQARTALATYLAHDAGAWLALNTTEATHRLLLTETAELTCLLARMSADSTHHGLAQRYFHLSAGMAAEAGNRSLYAIVLRATSAHAHQLGRRRTGMDQAAYDATPDSASPATRAYLLVQLALGLAHTGEPHQARRYLAQAEEHHARATEENRPFADYPRAGLDFQRAQVLLALDGPEPAITALRASLLHRPTQAHRSRALTHIQLAQLHLYTGHMEEASAHVHPCLEHASYLHSPLVRQHLLSLHTQLSAHRRHDPARRALREIRATLNTQFVPPKSRT